MQVVALDWSGATAPAAQKDAIWTAVVREGRLVELGNGRTRDEAIEHVVHLAGEKPRTVVGLDFAFSWPEWYLDANGLAEAPAAWTRAAELARRPAGALPCEFFGAGVRPVAASCLDGRERFRRTEHDAFAAGAGPSSTFHAGGAGAVGLQSIRGMPFLSRLAEAGFRVWPFDDPDGGRPLVVEVFPRLMARSLVDPPYGSGESFRAAVVAALPEDLFSDLPAARELMLSSQDAFDAAISAYALWDDREALAVLEPEADPRYRREGRIWRSTPTPDEVPRDVGDEVRGGVLVIDFGAQYNQLIARRIRECRVFSALVPHDTPPEEIAALEPAGLVLSGGPASVYEEGAPALDPRLLELGVPVLGICYGMQSMARSLGGEVARTGTAEFGKTALEVLSREGIIGDLPADTCWMSHRDSVVRAPEGFTVSARTQGSPVAAMEDPRRRLFGVQFHPEVVHTPFGTELLKAFLFDECEVAPTWTATQVIEDQIGRIRAQVGDGRAICALSGGVDSAVAALLVHRAIGDRLTCVFVDHGLMRMNEGEQVEAAFRRHFGVPLVHVRAQERFLARLAGVTDPERKRRIIGEEFIRVFEAEARKLGDVRFLVQGTLYSDVIESGSRDASKIKSHHNVGGLPEQMDVELVEPLRQLFKDEVRVVGEELGLPERMVWRQPFPGPGLAIRVIGEVTRERLDILRAADHVLQEEIRRAGLYRELWQSFAVLPAIRSVGVQGDERTYAYPIVIRAVTSDDAMTADWARLPHELLERVSNRIINEVPGVNRVALDLTSKPPGTIEWE